MVQVSATPPSERYPGRPSGGRIVVIAPTRAACETIEMGVGLEGIETVLNREHGDVIRRLAAAGDGFGIVAGTGTGKTLAIRPIATEIVGAPLRVGVVNREREATPETPTWNVVIVTTGIARRWLQDALITEADTLVVDEIHQTSAELELCLALGKRAGCRFIWLSATVDPAFYSDYLNSAEVIQSSAFDPARAATVRVHSSTNPLLFLSDRFLRHVVKQRRGVAVFVPTRAETEKVAASIAESWPRISAEFYHGGEPISKLRPFLEGDAPHPYVLSMTAAGQSALNIQGLDTVVIEDAQFTSVVSGGKRVLTRIPLGANEILQMAGRVHGRVEGGEVWLLSERQIDFASLEPTAPNFQLAGDPERVAMTCADIGVRADDLELPVPLDRIAYRRAVELLEERGLIHGARLTPYGRKIEVLPVDRSWGELLIAADEPLVPLVAVCAGTGSLYRMTRADRSIRSLIVPGSDHLTSYNIYEEALRRCGSVGTVYDLPRHVFEAEELEAWAEERGVLVRTIEDAALAVAAIYRALDLDLPAQLPRLDDALADEWRRLIAATMPFDLVVDQETSWGQSVQVSQTSVCGSWGAVAGDLRWFSTRNGRVRGGIEGTELPYKLLWEFASQGAGDVVYDPANRRAPLRLRRERSYHGFELEADEQRIDVFPAEHADAARDTLAAAMAAGAAYHRDAKQNRPVIRQLRELHRRSGGDSLDAGEEALAARFRERLQQSNSYGEFLESDLALDLGALVPAAERDRLAALPDTIELLGEEHPLDYLIEAGEAIARARVPVKLIARLTPEDVPPLDRPLHWTVLRGKRSAIRAASLDEARERLAAAAAEPRRERRQGGAKRGAKSSAASTASEDGAKRGNRRRRRRKQGSDGGRGRSPTSGKGDPRKRRGGKPKKGGG